MPEQKAIYLVTLHVLAKQLYIYPIKVKIAFIYAVPVHNSVLNQSKAKTQTGSQSIDISNIYLQ